MSDLDQLVARFDAVVRPFWTPYPVPTSISLGRIEEHFGLILPTELVWFARNSKSFSSWFASLGPDYESENHIMRINSHWRRRRRTRRIPDRLVAFNRGFDDDLNCFDLQRAAQDGNYPVRCWSPGSEGGESYSCFVSYIEDYIRTWEGI